MVIAFFYTHRKKTTDGGGGGELLLGVVAHEAGDGLLDLGGDGVPGGDGLERAVVVRVVVELVTGAGKHGVHVAALVDDAVVLFLADGKVLGLTLLAERVRVKDLVVLSHLFCWWWWWGISLCVVVCVVVCVYVCCVYETF